MKVKLDGNLDTMLAALFADGGHDTQTVLDQHLSGRPDEAIYDACKSESRTLLTLDLDFANPFRFPPGPTAGIVVLRPQRPTIPLVRMLIEQALSAMAAQDLAGKLWVVEPGRMRVYDPADEA